MKKLISKTVLSAMAVATCLHAQPVSAAGKTQALVGAEALTGGVVGNGGGGVAIDGRYVTFYTAGLYIEPQERTDQTVPNLQTLVSAIEKMKFLSSFTKAQLESTILPSPGHTYFAADASKFDATTQARLIAEYARVTNVPTERLVLFAITDTNARQTFLLPNFFQLSAMDQMAILFHESYWLMHPSATYDDVISAEIAFEAVLAKPDDGLRILDLIQHVGTPSDQLLYALQTDKSTAALKGLVNGKNQVSLVALFGKDFLNCVAAGDRHPFTDSQAQPACQTFVLVHFNQLQQKYPKSILIPFFLSRVGRGDSEAPNLFWSADSEEYRAIDENLQTYDHYGDEIRRIQFKMTTAVLSLNPSIVAASHANVRLTGTSDGIATSDKENESQSESVSDLNFYLSADRN